MTAGEDQAQAIVGHGVVLHRLVAGVQQRRLGVAILPRRLAPQPIDGAVARGGDDPAGRARRQAARRPARHGRGEGILHRLLGDGDVAEHAHEDRHGAAVFGAEHPLDRLGSGVDQ
jgi:hypothetical protein